MDSTRYIDPLPAVDAAAAVPIRQVEALHRRLGRNVSFVIGASSVTLVVLAAIFAPMLTSYDPYYQDIANRTLPPIWHHYLGGDPGATWAHPLGTDKLGRDYWTRLAYGARISLSIGFAVVLLSGMIGVILGVAAGYFGGWIDHAVNLLISARLSVPVVLVALAVVSLYQSSFGVVIAVLGLLLWDRFAVVTRAATMQIRSREFILAARAAGASNARIIWQEVMPNILDALIVVATVEIAHAILLEAALSFLGLGVQPPLPSWGLMLADAKEEIFFSPWMIALPGAALFWLVLSINLMGDGIRDSMAGGDAN